ncbi:MAG TPA: LamG-like jellyroll fold domain-containing protein, partial [Acidobacteriaceae bacterium]|nr:LamG-like jellyroll fold domain-containing protein [Acidobacteriaceae bacterium]
AEVLQLGYIGRVPSFIDIAGNTCGAVAGYLATKPFLKRADGPRSLVLYRVVAVAAIPIAILGTLAILPHHTKSDFSNWNSTFHVAVGNELTQDRPWSGTISEFAIYPVAMTPEQINELAVQTASSNTDRIAGKVSPEAPIVERMHPAGSTTPLRLLSKQEELKLYDTLVSRNQLTLAVLMRTNDLEQTGPARIVTYSQNEFSRNFTLAQIRNTLTFRLRTPNSGPNGANPALYTGPVLKRNTPAFVAAVYDGRFSSLYVDGKRVARVDLGAKRPRLPRRILSWFPGSLPIPEIELGGAEILLSGLFAIGIFALCGIPRRPLIRFFAGALAGAAIGAIVWVFGVSEPRLGMRIFMECVAAGLVISASMETVTADDHSRGRHDALNRDSTIPVVE